MALNEILPGPVAASMTRWHDMVARMDFSALPALVHADAVFRSPMAHTPYHSREAVCLALNTVGQVFEDFRYHREFATPDGSSVVLEFTAVVNGKQLTGADFIRFDAEGLIVDFQVMIRPMSGLAALGEEMGRRLAGAMKGYS